MLSINDGLMVIMTTVAEIADWRFEQFRLAAGMGHVAGGAIALLKWFVGMGQLHVWAGDILPMAFPADILQLAPHLRGIGALQIMADAAGAIAKGLVDKVQAFDRRRAQTSFGGDGRGRGRHKGRRGRSRRRLPPATCAHNGDEGK